MQMDWGTSSSPVLLAKRVFVQCDSDKSSFLVALDKMTGDELGRRFRIAVPGVKVLYLTGFSDRLFKEKVTLWADEAFLDKPMTVTGLLDAVSLLLFGGKAR